MENWRRVVRVGILFASADSIMEGSESFVVGVPILFSWEDFEGFD